MGDERFNRVNFARQPQWLVKQAIAATQQQRNLDHLTTARHIQLYANANRSKDAQPFDDVGIFLPHPHQWAIQSNDTKVKVSRKCAIEFLQSYKSFGSQVEFAFDDWLRDIQICASL